MSIETKVIATCDLCKQKETTTYAAGPITWAKAQLRYVGNNGSAAAVPIDWHLCNQCAHKVEQAMMRCLTK